jgi:hypothetical protein
LCIVIRFWDSKTHKSSASVKLSSLPMDLAWRPNSTEVAVCERSFVSLIDLKTSKVLRQQKFNSEVAGLSPPPPPPQTRMQLCSVRMSNVVIIVSHAISQM